MCQPNTYTSVIYVCVCVLKMYVTHTHTHTTERTEFSWRRKIRLGETESLPKDHTVGFGLGQPDATACPGVLRKLLLHTNVKLRFLSGKFKVRPPAVLRHHLEYYTSPVSHLPPESWASKAMDPVKSGSPENVQKQMLTVCPKVHCVPEVSPGPSS